MATEWRWLPESGIAHAFVRPPGRSACGLISWEPGLWRANDDDPRCADCEADLRGMAEAERRPPEAPLSELELRWAWGDR